MLHVQHRWHRIIAILLLVAVGWLCLWVAPVKAQSVNWIEGEALLRQGDYKAAVEALTEVLQDPATKRDEAGLAYTSRAYGYLMLRDWKRANEDLSQALIRFPTDAWSLQRRCWVNTRLQNYLAAKRDCDTALLHAKSAEVRVATLHARSQLYHSVDLHTFALRDLDMALEIADDDYLFRSRAELRYFLEDYRGAVQDYGVLIERRSHPLPTAREEKQDLANILWSQGMSLYEQGDLAQAVESYSAALALDGEEAGYHNSRCWTLALLNRAEEGIDNCKKAVELDDQESAYWDSLGYALFLIKRNDDALAALNRGLELSPDDTWILFHRSLVHEALSNRKAAHDDLVKLSQLRPDWEVARAKYAEYDIKPADQAPTPNKPSP